MKSKLMSLAVIAGLLVSLNSTAAPAHTFMTAKAHPSAAVDGVPLWKAADLKDAYEQYVQVQAALAKDDAAGARKSAAGLAASLKGVRNADAALKAAGTISGTSDIAMQRQAFVMLSASMIKLLKADKPEGIMSYIHFCPMANHNKGAYWLSNDKAIRNPYLGRQMPSCGKTTGMIM